MTAQETAWQAAESAAAVLAPDAGVFGSVDAAGLGASTLAVMRRAAAKPTDTASATMRFWTSMAMAGPVAAARSTRPSRTPLGSTCSGNAGGPDDTDPSEV